LKVSLLNNHCQLQRLLRLAPADIVNDNPFYQRKTARQAGCQIDYPIQAKYNTLYVCKTKFSGNAIGSSAIPELQVHGTCGREVAGNIRDARHAEYNSAGTVV
jgi:hypothetical protein